MKPTCKACAYFIATQAENGECRREAPTAFFALSNGGLSGKPQPMIFSGWPPVTQTQWCGEYSSAA